jgi:transposase InsO family protein
MKTKKDGNKTVLAKSLGCSRSSLYYVSKKETKDWLLKIRIEAVLREHPGYGSRSIRDELKINRKRVQRVMRKFGLRPYRRRGRKWRRKKAIAVVYPNLLATIIPSCRGHIWAADFTELLWRDHLVYVATVIDLYTREIAGIAVALRKGAVLTIQALCSALLQNPRPAIFHSDNGKEYEAKSFVALLTNLNVKISRSHPGCPWENGYQESFYGKFKVDLGDPNRFETLGELVAEVYQTIWTYNHTRIHSALRMPPRVFANKQQFNSLKTLRVTV